MQYETDDECNTLLHQSNSMQNVALQNINSSIVTINGQVAENSKAIRSMKQNDSPKLIYLCLFICALISLGSIAFNIFLFASIKLDSCNCQEIKTSKTHVVNADGIGSNNILRTPNDAYKPICRAIRSDKY